MCYLWLQGGGCLCRGASRLGGCRASAGSGCRGAGCQRLRGVGAACWCWRTGTPRCWCLLLC
eukprot:12424168-Karenia_brevis.AAC.1